MFYLIEGTFLTISSGPGTDTTCGAFVIIALQSLTAAVAFLVRDWAGIDVCLTVGQKYANRCIICITGFLVHLFAAILISQFPPEEVIVREFGGQKSQGIKNLHDG